MSAPAERLSRRRLLQGLLGLSLGLPLGAAPGKGPRRVVSVGGAITETVFALGAGDHVVGVDTSSIHPPRVRDLPQVGYQRVLSAEGVLALRPDLLLADEGAGPPEAIRQLRSSGMTVHVVPNEPSANGVLARVHAVGSSLGRETEARDLAAGIARDLSTVRHAIDTGSSEAPRVLLLMAHGRGSLLAAGARTSGEAMIELAGGHNAMHGFQGYKPVSAEAVVAAAPEVIVVPEQSLEALGGSERAMAVSGLSATPAARSGRVVVMELLYLLGMGPRTAHAAADLAKAFHPGLRLNLVEAAGTGS